MNFNASLQNASGISLRNGSLPFVRFSSLRRTAPMSRLRRPSNGAWQRSNTRRMARKSILMFPLDAFRIHQPRAPTMLL